MTQINYYFLLQRTRKKTRSELLDVWLSFSRETLLCLKINRAVNSSLLIGVLGKVDELICIHIGLDSTGVEIRGVMTT